MNDSSDISVFSFTKVKTVIKILFSTAAKQYPLFFVLETVRTVIGIAQPFVALLVSPLIVDELIGGRDIHKLITYACILILGEFVFAVVDYRLNMNLQKYQVRLDNYFEMLLGEKAMQLDFPLTENKDVLDQLQRAKSGILWNSGGAYELAEQLFSLIRNVVSMAGFLVIIVLHAPLLLVVALVYILINSFLTIKVNKIQLQTFEQTSKEDRLFAYFGWNIVDPRYAKDIRLYEAQEMMTREWRHNSKALLEQMKGYSDRAILYWLASDVLSSIRCVFAYFYVGLLAMQGRFSIGIFTQLVSAEVSLNGSLNHMVQNITGLVKRCNFAYEYVLFMETASVIPKGSVGIRSVPHDIEFKNVSFSYPDSERKVLDHVSLRIKAGEHLALVGRNGAGKTTFIKLLCRLYEPTEGEILIDGRDIREYDYREYMEQFAPVFQDFRLFAISIRENIVFDKAYNAKDLDKMISAVGLDDLMECLEKKADTQIMKIFDESGIEPSGGEQQKIAIARALFKDSPVVILDEPTSALDPLAEYEIYKNFSTLVGNRTAFYISHRLSSCRFCDHIAVFDRGTIREYGDHDTLIKMPDGLYAEMYEAQAKYYKA